MTKKYDQYDVQYHVDRAIKLVTLDILSSKVNSTDIRKYNNTAKLMEVKMKLKGIRDYYENR